MGPLYSLLSTPDLQFVMELLVVHLLQLEQGCGSNCICDHHVELADAASHNSVSESRLDDCASHFQKMVVELHMQ